MENVSSANTALSAIGIAAAIAITVSAALAWLMLRSSWHWALDHPGSRSLHAAAVPRTGGLALMAGVLAAGCFVELQATEALTREALTGHWLWLETLCAGALGALSLIDDRRGLPVSVRLMAHFIVACVYAGLLLRAGSAAVALPLVLGVALCIAAMTNFFNFMDGTNGLAGGMTVIGQTACAFCAWPSDPTLAALCLAMAGAAVGFLLFNLPGRIFMGDGGSVPLGFLTGAVGVYGWHNGLWPYWFVPLVFAPFIVDAGITLTKRIMHREKFWQAHRGHYYQRVVRMGASHAQLACMEYALMLVCAVGAIWARQIGITGQLAIFATIGVVLASLILSIDARWRRFMMQNEAA